MRTAISLVLLAICAHAAEREVSIPQQKYKSFFVQKNEPDQSVGPFKIDRDAVTNGEFLEFVHSHPEWQKSHVSRLMASSGYLKSWSEDLKIPDGLKDKPVTHVSWFAARKYCAARGKRLPTVAEWEIASDADNPKNQDIILKWYARPSGAPVSESANADSVNAFGVRGMHGVNWEWVEDFGSVIIQGDSRESNATSSSLFCGAGSANARDRRQYATFMRFAFRSSLKANYVGSSLGFRCAR